MDASTPDRSYERMLALHHQLRLRRGYAASGSPHPGRSAPDPCSAPPTDRDRVERFVPGAGRLERPHPGDADLLMETFRVVGPGIDDMVADFYRLLFRTRPYLRRIVGDGTGRQRERLVRTLLAVAHRIEDPPSVAPMLRRLAIDHRRYGVQPVHYEIIGAALLGSLRYHCGRHWTTRMQYAWLRAYRYAAGVMVAEAEASPDPPYWYATVVGHQRRARDIAVLTMRPEHPYRYLAGQYAMVESPALPGQWRPYSLAAAPRPGRPLEFHVRSQHPDGVSAALVHRTRVGDPVRLGPARGDATLPDDPARDLLLVAGGTGLAPMKSLADEVCRRADPRQVHLFVGARHRGELYDLPALHQLRDHCANLTVYPVLSEDTGYPGLTGLVPDVVARYGDWSGHEAFLSGPPAMVDAGWKRLVGVAVPAERIHHDVV